MGATLPAEAANTVPEELVLLRRIAALARASQRVMLLAAAVNVEAGVPPEAAYQAMFGRRGSLRRSAKAMAR